MQVLGQDVETDDVILFPRRNRLQQPYYAKVARLSGRRAYDATGNSRLLDFDVHVAVVELHSPAGREWVANGRP